MRGSFIIPQDFGHWLRLRPSGAMRLDFPEEAPGKHAMTSRRKKKKDKKEKELEGNIIDRFLLWNEDLYNILLLATCARLGLGIAAGSLLFKLPLEGKRRSQYYFFWKKSWFLYGHIFRHLGLELVNF